MPIEPPDPGKILEALKSVLLELRDLSSARPEERRLRSARALAAGDADRPAPHVAADIQPFPITLPTRLCA